MDLNLLVVRKVKTAIHCSNQILWKDFFDHFEE